jgi:hypothetical protein
MKIEERECDRDVSSRPWVALLVVAVAFVAGCGGGAEGPPSGTTRETHGGALTKTELIQRGDAICAKAYATTESINPEGSTREAARFAGLSSSMVKRLLDLGTPQETEYAYAEYTTGAKAFIEAETEVKAAVKRGNPAVLKRAEASSLSALSMFQAVALAYGFKDCAEAT